MSAFIPSFSHESGLPEKVGDDLGLVLVSGFGRLSWAGECGILTGSALHMSYVDGGALVGVRLLYIAF